MTDPFFNNKESISSINIEMGSRIINENIINNFLLFKSSNILPVYPNRDSIADVIPIAEL